FSSRRRHTRSKRDWSSDVCSSDLSVVGGRWSVVGGRWGAAGGSAASAVGGLGVRGGAFQRELDAELVGAVLPLAGALHLVGADRGVELQGEPAAHAHRRGGGLRCDRGDQRSEEHTSELQ